MATYYVSATTGNDSNDGTSVGTAKATIGAGENLATSAGDIVYIAPGTYRELVVHGYSGTASNRIYFIGDPDCEIFGNAVKPGVVRITLAADSNEFASDGNANAHATSFAACVNAAEGHGGKILAVATDATVALTQVEPGPDGNTAIVETLHANVNAISAAFTGG